METKIRKNAVTRRILKGNWGKEWEKRAAIALGQPAKLTQLQESYQICFRVAASADAGIFEGTVAPGERVSSPTLRITLRHAQAAGAW